MPLDLARDTIFATLAGSHAHGTAREGSDVDVRGVCIAPMDVRVQLGAAFEQAEGALEGRLRAKLLPALQAHASWSTCLENKAESVIFDIAKFLQLCATANPNALEILFADERDWLLSTPAWIKVHGARHRFLTKKVEQTFLGYALAQLKRIRSHRAWLLEPPKAKPTRSEFGLPDIEATLNRDDQDRIERAIADRIRSYGFDVLEIPKPTRVALEERMRSFLEDQALGNAHDIDDLQREIATRALRLPSEVASALSAERRYPGALKQWESFQTWERQRNPARAALERRFGYDTKHAAHLIRLMRMGLEALRDGDLRVRRDDACELHAIRDGALPYDALIAMAETLQQEMKNAGAKTTLPDDIDRDFVNELLLSLVLGGS